MEIKMWIKYRRWRNLSDEELMRLVRRHDSEKAFDELYRRYARRIHGFFFRMLGRDEHLAADFTQDIFLRLWVAKERYTDGRNVRSWLFAMAYNLCRNEYRSRGYQADYIGQLDREEDIYEEPVALRIDAEVFDRELSRLLDTLQPAQRLLFALRYEEELSVAQVAEIMNLPEGTVKSRLYYMLQNLRNKLKIYEKL